MESRLSSPKAKTLTMVFKSLIAIIVLFVTILVVLSHLGVNIVPILTGAGLLGLAVSLGAQSLFKDLFAGFFIVIEGQYHLGDEIKIGDFKGEVYNITLRTTTLKDRDGNLIYIPNSAILNVKKYLKKTT